ncbi:antigen 5 like allergen Cul n 1 [Drosophila ficusphila]|uniref:antigen 5 like allergen Cul n 1 n=1 Tax=Drosophila ficusphila TaxID=30025 RepID=UPI0007E776DF|nr:antigen 5 like allergen Cul n 1 [Drosophila ficusphila]
MFQLREWFICAVILSLLSFPVRSWDYCQEHWCPRFKDHVACNNNGSFGPQCGSEAKLVPLSGPLSRFIVDQVNFYRNQVASGDFSGFGAAHRMASVRWDPELAQLAELAARRCTLSADECRNTRRFKHVGQLTGHVIFSAGRHSDTELLGHKIANWFAQYKRATRELGAADQASDITSFRQLMQERATHMGCGVLRQRAEDRWHQQFIVCNFAREDVAHEPAYEVGLLAATGCQAGRNLRYPNLCALQEPYDVNAVDRFHQKPPLRIKIRYSGASTSKGFAATPGLAFHPNIKLGAL